MREYMQVTTDDPIAPEEVLINLICNYKVDCKDKRCNCVKQNMICNGCGCSEVCENSDSYIKSMDMEDESCNDDEENYCF